MPRNGSGTYILPPGNPVVDGTLVTSSWANTTLNDLSAGLTQSLSKDGQTSPTGNLTMGGYTHTNVGNATARTQYAALGQVQDSTGQWLVSLSGTDTITATTAPVIPAYVLGQTFRFLSTGANATSSVTLNINGLGAKAVKKNGSVSLAAGDIAASSVAQVVYDGTQFQLISIVAISFSTLLAGNNAFTGNNTFNGSLSVGAPYGGSFSVQGGRSYFVANNELLSIGVNYKGADGTYWLGATDSATPALVFSNSVGAERMRIDDAGNVGIGESNPSGWNSKLVVKATSGANQISIVNAGSTGSDWSTLNTYAGGTQTSITHYGTGSAYLTTSGFALQIQTTAASPVLINTNSVERVRVDAAGNVGIGINAPTSKLHVYQATGNISAQVVTGNVSNATLVLANSARTYNIACNSAGVLDFWDASAGASRLNIDSNGLLSSAIYGATGTYQMFSPRVWLVFNGSGGVASNQTVVRSGGVTSVYKNATGDYTVNFSVTLPDNTYALSGAAAGTGAGPAASSFIVNEYWNASANVGKTSTSCRIIVTDNNSDSLIDAMSISATFIR
jgi:hypothetical protein